MKQPVNVVAVVVAACLVAITTAMGPSAAHAATAVSAAWTQSSAQGPSARAGSSIAYDSRHRVSYLFGGSSSVASSLTADTWQYDGTKWTQLPVPGPSPRYLAPMVYDSARGVSVLFGGYNNGVLGDTWEWNGSTWTQRFTLNSPSLRLWTAMAYDSVRHVTVLFGGAIDTGPFNDTWQYDGNDWTQVVTAHAPAPRRGMGLAFDPMRGRTVLFGGQDATGTDLSDTWEFDGTDWSNVTTTTSPLPRLWHSMVYDPNLGSTVVFGGATTGYQSLDDTWLYDGSTWQRLPFNIGLSSRWWASADFDAERGALVMFGGTADSVFTFTYADTWTLTGITTSPPDWGQLVPAASPSPRVWSQMDYDAAHGFSVLFGGSSDGGPGNLPDTWEWNGSSWQQMSPAASPPGLAAAMMAYDSARGVSVLFGGSGSSGFSSATWEWDGSSWTQRALTSGPSARVWAAMAYDSGRGRMVLFGGDGSGGALNDTWEYDGKAWTQASPTTAPSPRFGSAFAYDPIRGRTVLFGGRDASGQRTADTWEWDGSSWTQIATPAAPYARFWSSMAFDAQIGKVVLFGGDHIQPFALGEENDTWDWDGSSWARDWTAAAPPVRAGHAMSYDSARGRMVLFGGFNPATSPGTFYRDTWELGAGIETPAGSPNDTLNIGGQGANFGNVNVGATGANPAAIVLSSTGTGPLTINSITTSGDFAVSTTDCPSSADVLASGSFCVTLVTFTPTAGGPRSGSLTISDNDPNGGFVVQLQGTGVLIPTSLGVTPATALFNTSATFTATLTANGSPLAGQAVKFSLPTGVTATIQTNAQGTATWAGATLAGLHAGTYSSGISASFSGGSGYAASSASATLTVTQPVLTRYSGDYFDNDTTGAHLAVNIDQRTPAGDPQFLDYGSNALWARFEVDGPASSSAFYAQVVDAPDWATSGLGFASVDVPALPSAGYTVVVTLVSGSGSTTPSSAVAGDEVRVGLVSSPTKGGYLSGGGAIANDPSANTSDTHGYFSFQMKPGAMPQGNLVYVFRANIDVGGGNRRDVDVWVTSTDVASLSGSGGSAEATGHFSVEYVDAQTGQRYASLEFAGGTYRLSVTNATNKAPAGFALVLKRPDGTVFHASGPVNSGGNAQAEPVVLGSLVSSL